jgi:hypothetical protein
MILPELNHTSGPVGNPLFYIVRGDAQGQPPRPDPTLPGFIRLCDDPTREEISLATLASSLRGQVAKGMIAQAAADAQLKAFRERLERDPFGPDFRPMMAAHAAATPPKRKTRAPRYTDLGKEATIAGCIAAGTFGRIAPDALCPLEAFAEPRWRIVCGAAYALHTAPAGPPVCLETVNDYIAMHGFDKELQREVDSSNLVNWRKWDQFADTSIAHSSLGTAYCLSELARLYQERQAKTICQRVADEELEPKEALAELEKILHRTNGANFNFEAAANAGSTPRGCMTSRNRRSCSTANRFARTATSRSSTRNRRPVKAPSSALLSALRLATTRSAITSAFRAGRMRLAMRSSISIPNSRATITSRLCCAPCAAAVASNCRRGFAPTASPIFRPRNDAPFLVPKSSGRIASARASWR